MDSHIQQLISTYQAPQDVINELRPIRTVMLTGITASGKDTIIGDILRESHEFVRVVTSTTRAMRTNNGIMEQHGREYYFFSETEALDKMAHGEYIEVAPVHGRINGSLIADYRRIADLNKIAITDINYEGASNFLKFGMDNLFVYFVMPPSFEIWLARLMGRQGGVIGERDELLRRFRSAQAELENALRHPEFIPITNDVSQDTAQKIIHYTQTQTGPTDEERQQAHEAIRALSESIARYISQLENTR